MAKVEPTKEENEAGIAELKRELRSNEPEGVLRRNSRVGLYPVSGNAYRIVCDETQLVGARVRQTANAPVADIFFDPSDDHTRQSARRLAERIADWINADCTPIQIA